MTAAMRTLLVTLALARAWQPQLPQHGNWTQLIEEELERSLRVYERPTNVIRPTAWRSNFWQDPDRFVLILGDTLIADARLLFNKKGLHHLEFVKSTIERKGHANVLYNYEWNADGYRSEDQLVREGCATPFQLTRVKPRILVTAKNSKTTTSLRHRQAPRVCAVRVVSAQLLF